MSKKSSQKNGGNDAGGEQQPTSDTIGAATRALVDATATLTRVLGEQVSQIVPDVQDSLATSLRQVSTTLNQTAEMTQKRNVDSRKRRVDKTKAGLIEAATRVFAEKGYEGASVGDIAAAAGFTKGALYAHFKSKEELFFAMVQEISCQGVVLPEINPPVAESIAGWLEVASSDNGALLSLEILAYILRHPESSEDLPDTVDAVVRQLAVPVSAYRHGLSTEEFVEASLMEENAISADNNPDQSSSIDAQASNQLQLSYYNSLVDEGDLETAMAIVSLANQCALYGQTGGAGLGSYGSFLATARVIVSLIETNHNR